MGPVQAIRHKGCKKGLMFSLSCTALALARRYEHTTLMHWRDQQLQTMLAVTVKMSRVRSNQCVVGVLESFLSSIFCSRFQQYNWTLPCRVFLLSYFHKIFMLSYSSVILVGLVVFLQVARSMDACAWPSRSFLFFLFFSLLLLVLLLPSVILFLFLLRLTVITMDLLSFPIQYSLLSSCSYTDLSSMVLSFSAHHIIRANKKQLSRI